MTDDDNVVIREANDEEFVVAVELVVVIDAAKDELALVVALCKPFMRVAAELLFVVIVAACEVMLELNEADAL